MGGWRRRGGDDGGGAGGPSSCHDGSSRILLVLLRKAWGKSDSSLSGQGSVELRVAENEKEKLEVFLGIRLICEVPKEVAARDGMTSLGRQNVIEGELGWNIRCCAAALQNKRAVGLESL